MRHSNSYILIYTVVLCVVCAVSLALVSNGLTPWKDANKSFKAKSDILATFISAEEIEKMEKSKVEEVYKARVKGYVVNLNGEIVKDKKVEEIIVSEEYKKVKEMKAGSLDKSSIIYLPVYEIVDEKDATKTQFFVVPTYGFGLWNNIWSYVCFENDFNTIKGIKFDHKGETPGLGARLKDDPKVYNRYKGKKIWDGTTLKSVTMQKGEGNDYSSDPYSVDGMSGSTLTGDGADIMFTDYFGLYSKFIQSKLKK